MTLTMTEQPREPFTLTMSERPRNQDPLDELKQAIALGEYEVDCDDLADAILWKLGVLKRLRQDLTAEGEEPGSR